MGTITRDRVSDWLGAITRAIGEHKDHLTELDAAIGDADHGINMDRGFQAVMGRLGGVPVDDVGGLLTSAGMVLVSSVGGASGPLYGTFFLRMGSAAKGRAELAGGDVLALLAAGVKGIEERGKAAPGDKTMLDALMPALDELRAALEGGDAIGAALRRAAAAAEQGARATIPMKARKGRASYLGERSVGHKDPGATSAALILGVMAECLAPGEA